MVEEWTWGKRSVFIHLAFQMLASSAAALRQGLAGVCLTGSPKAKELDRAFRLFHVCGAQRIVNTMDTWASLLLTDETPALGPGNSTWEWLGKSVHWKWLTPRSSIWPVSQHPPSLHGVTDNFVREESSMVFMLPMRKLRCRKREEWNWSHMTSEWQRWDVNQ